MTEHRSYYAIIPANVRYDKRLKPNTKLLYGEITALCNERGFCWAGNEYFADLYGVNKETISRWVSDLIKFGYLNREIIYKEGTNQIINRYLRINQYPIDEKRNTPIDEKVKDNNTLLQTDSIEGEFISDERGYVYLTAVESEEMTLDKFKNLVNNKAVE
ncbi:helix-turn-helix domain-containing protein [Enterococcus faecium]|uniref:helix-turn-helix domain-containing protein n=1 Tax=Enterococcus faecium TaxID=1352 RepID=UPI0035DAD372